MADNGAVERGRQPTDQRQGGGVGGAEESAGPEAATAGKITIGGHESIGGHSRVPTNEKRSSTNENAIGGQRQIKRGWIEWTARETKKYGKRRYPRYREWLWDGSEQKWIKSSPVYREDLPDAMNEEDYVKYAKRRDKARKLGF